MLQKHQLQEHVAGADCKGPRCGRGHPAWGATKKPFAFGAKAGGGGIEVNVDGKMEKLFLPGAHVKAARFLEASRGLSHAQYAYMTHIRIASEDSSYRCQ